MPAGGFSPAGLRRLREIMTGHVERGALPGVVTLLCRRGEVHVDAIGRLAEDNGQPMAPETIFRIASLTKPIVAAAAMTLVEECKLRLDDPVDPWLPELANRQVLRRLDGPLDDTVPAHRAITLRDLLTFRLGHGAIMVFPEKYPIQRAMVEAGVAPGPLLPSVPADELMRRYGSLPLLHQPGERWLYNSGSDILGVLVARVSGMTLEEFLRGRLFIPLGMRDTGFSVPSAAIDRLATCYRGEPTSGKLVVFDGVRDGRFAKPPLFQSGAGGLVATAGDYLAFGQMMLANGRHGTARILSRASVELMTTDQITPEQKAASPFFPGFWESRGWGFGLSVVTARRELAGNPGRFGWDGGYGTSAYMDPREDLVAILMTQLLWASPAGPAVHRDFWTAVYQAIDD